MAFDMHTAVCISATQKPVAISMLALGLVVFLSLSTSDAFVSLDSRCHIWRENRDSSFLPTKWALGLFFRPVQMDTPTWKVPKRIVNKLSTSDLPWTVELEVSKPSMVPGIAKAPVLQVRPLRRQDVSAIAEMCVQEYGSDLPSSVSILDKAGNLFTWLDREGLRMLVEVTSHLKVAAARGVPKDHAILVSSVDDTIIGMVEVSLQPVIPELNPSPYPIPLVVKQAFASLTQTKVQGWVTNLLIAPEHRGRGHAKVLVAACEAVAASWNVDSIHLHCDADEMSGQVSQGLYTGMGYETLPPAEDPSLAWMMDWSNNGGFMSNSVFMIQGVPLLYLRKRLKA